MGRASFTKLLLYGFYLCNREKPLFIYAIKRKERKQGLLYIQCCRIQRHSAKRKDIGNTYIRKHIKQIQKTYIWQHNWKNTAIITSLLLVSTEHRYLKGWDESLSEPHCINTCTSKSIYDLRKHMAKESSRQEMSNWNSLPPVQSICS